MKNCLTLVAVVVGALFATKSQAQQQPPSTQWTPDQIAEAVETVRAGRKLSPREWPNGARVAVCLSFDVDNETLSLNRGNTAPVTLSAGEFGAMSGLLRVLDLLDRHQVPASFFIPAVSAMLHPSMIHEIIKSGSHEVGVHGWIHENLSGNGRSRRRRTSDEPVDRLPDADD